MTPGKEHPKIMIVKIIFLFCIVRLDKPVIVPQRKDLEELLVATSFPLNSATGWTVLLWKWAHSPIQLRRPQQRPYPHTQTIFKYGFDVKCHRVRFCSCVGHFLWYSNDSCLNPVGDSGIPWHSPVTWSYLSNPLKDQRVRFCDSCYWCDRKHSGQEEALRESGVAAGRPARAACCPPRPGQRTTAQNVPRTLLFILGC